MKWLLINNTTRLLIILHHRWHELTLYHSIMSNSWWWWCCNAIPQHYIQGYRSIARLIYWSSFLCLFFSLFFFLFFYFFFLVLMGYKPFWNWFVRSCLLWKWTLATNALNRRNWSTRILPPSYSISFFNVLYLSIENSFFIYLIKLICYYYWILLIELIIIDHIT